MRKKRSSAEFYDPFGESTSFNATTKPMNLKSRRSSEASLFSTGSASSWNDFFSGETKTKTAPPTLPVHQPPSKMVPPTNNMVKKKKDMDSETESFISRMKHIEEERRARRKREDAERWEREAEARRAAHHARSFTPKEVLPKKVTKPPSLSYSEHISDERVTQHGNVISESNLKAAQAIIQKLHPAVLRQHEKSKFSVGDVVRSRIRGVSLISLIHSTPTQVQLCRLQRNTEYNGKIGTVKKYVRKDKLYVVNLETSGDKVDVIAVRGSNLRYPVADEEEEEEEEEKSRRRRRRRWRPDVGYNDELEWLRKMALVSKALDSKVYGDAHYIL